MNREIGNQKFGVEKFFVCQIVGAYCILRTHTRLAEVFSKIPGLTKYSKNYTLIFTPFDVL